LRFSRFSSVLVIGLAVSSVAFAESAREAYSRGLSLYSAGRFTEAADAFLAAYAKKPKPLILFNVGQAYRKCGELEQALTYYRRFLDEASPDERAPLEEETRKYVHEIEAEEALKRSLSESADREEANSLRFDKPAQPAAPPPANAATRSQATPAPKAAVPPPPIAAAPAPTVEEHTKRAPLVQKWWFWTSLGVVVAGAAVGLGVGLGSRSNDPSTALGTRQPMF